MKYFYVLLVFAFICSCKNQTPCLDQLIVDFQKDDAFCEGSARVEKFLFEGDTVYHLFPGTCGQNFESTVYNQNCVEICKLGGANGTLNCKGTSFARSQLLSIHWESK